MAGPCLRSAAAQRRLPTARLPLRIVAPACASPPACRLPISACGRPCLRIPRRGLANLITGRSLRGAMAGPAACRLCGRSFAPYGGTHHSCYKRCAAKADRAVGRMFRANCRECGREFSTAHRLARCCSDACGAEGRRRSLRSYNRRAMGDPEMRATALAYVGASSAGKGQNGERRRRRQKRAWVAPQARTVRPAMRRQERAGCRWRMGRRHGLGPGGRRGEEADAPQARGGRIEPASRSASRMA